MATVYIQCRFNIAGSLQKFWLGTEIPIFRVPINKETVEVTFEESSDLKYLIQTSLEKEVSDFTRGRLSQISNWEQYDTLPMEVLEATSSCREATIKVLSILKYLLNMDSINSDLCSLKSINWSNDNTSWNPISWNQIIRVPGIEVNWITEDVSVYIQKTINENIQPWVALKYMEHAKRERIPNHKWIYATIAAELAIKEFLIRKEPVIGAILLELPSPPLDKLYGSILNKYTGSESPAKKVIKKGIETRNKLLHQASEFEIVEDEAIAYVEEIDNAINDLMIRLHSEESIFKFYSKTNGDVWFATKEERLQVLRNFGVPEEKLKEMDLT